MTPTIIDDFDAKVAEARQQIAALGLEWPARWSEPAGHTDRPIASKLDGEFTARIE